MAEVSFNTLKLRIKEILKGGDLDSLTSKKIRKQLEGEFKCSLDARKKELNELIERLLNEEEEEEGDGDGTPNYDNGHCSSSDSEGLKIDEEAGDAKDTKRKNPKKRKAPESSDSDSNLDDDAKLAKRLQDEEASRVRSTRSGLAGNSKKAKKSRTKKRSTDSDDEKPSKKGSGRGYMKTCKLSEDLSNFLGEAELPRHEVVKRMWAYVREKNLFDPKNKQFAICDPEMSKICGGQKRVRMFGIMKYIQKHIS